MDVCYAGGVGLVCLGEYEAFGDCHGWFWCVVLCCLLLGGWWWVGGILVVVGWRGFVMGA